MQTLLVFITALASFATAITLPSSSKVSVYLNNVKTGGLSSSATWVSSSTQTGTFSFSGTPAAFTMSTSAGSCYVTFPNATGVLTCDTSGHSSTFNAFSIVGRVQFIYANAGWSSNNLPTASSPQTVYSHAGHLYIYVLAIDNALP